jgi:hypothetical protein
MQSLRLPLRHGGTWHVRWLSNAVISATLVKLFGM